MQKMFYHNYFKRDFSFIEMKKCMNFSDCGGEVSNPAHDFCYECFLTRKEREDENYSPKDSFEENINDDRTHSVYIMFYENKNKIGYTSDLNSRVLEIKREFPKNEFVYFREFTKESEARRFEAWLKGLSERELNKFVSRFQDKIKKIKHIV